MLVKEVFQVEVTKLGLRIAPSKTFKLDGRTNSTVSHYDIGYESGEIGSTRLRTVAGDGLVGRQG